jgi:hypothetical protein
MVGVGIRGAGRVSSRRGHIYVGACVRVASVFVLIPCGSHSQNVRVSGRVLYWVTIFVRIACSSHEKNSSTVGIVYSVLQSATTFCASQTKVNDFCPMIRCPDDTVSDLGMGAATRGIKGFDGHDLGTPRDTSDTSSVVCDRSSDASNVAAMALVV